MIGKSRGKKRVAKPKEKCDETFNLTTADD